MDATLLEILGCPETYQPLSVAAAEQLTQVNVDSTGEDGKVLYPIRGSIPILLAEEGISL